MWLMKVTFFSLRLCVYCCHGLYYGCTWIFCWVVLLAYSWLFATVNATGTATTTAAAVPGAGGRIIVVDEGKAVVECVRGAGEALIVADCLECTDDSICLEPTANVEWLWI